MYAHFMTKNTDIIFYTWLKYMSNFQSFSVCDFTIFANYLVEWFLVLLKVIVSLVDSISFPP